ncbi:ubiquinol-cytochrome c reductase iron-sulfur subunit [Limnobacter sp.]|uniref:ubiquinol-cytochrome c reductase iron-sulfur subunit n=1 Tax=Limnobacter sp. TaxID=2003368 RepID=UPI0025859BA3|nr:ubiquinol-cytochrome c reductase iron-sulfur subunit [Limnobacter sp.]HEX5485181.1 ubiquinol-cytochrome c reductase iron-sulfur subunit [Limnobacter sp.]
MSNSQPVDKERRVWMIACGATGAVAAGATGVTLLSTMAPSERAKAAGAPVEVDISSLAPGEMKTVEWRGKPVWIVRRTKEEVAALAKHDNELADPNSERKPDELTPPYARNTYRSIKPEYFIAVGICTHLGCSPSARFTPGPQPSLPEDWPGGWLCPCHGSTFDLAGRVFKNKPAPDNLEIPPHEYLSDAKVIIGVDKDHKA